MYQTAHDIAVARQASQPRIPRVPVVDDEIVDAFDRAFGEAGWFLFWDEDMSGKPIRGTISLAFGTETLVVA
jgi:ribosomal protein L35AE/L33A